MSKIHTILQGKGGVGKSFIASTIAQYKKANNQVTLNIDTDPVNQTFYGFKALKVHSLKIMDKDEINTRNFDNLIEQISKTKHDVVIDNGASSFVPLSHYLISNDVPSLFNEIGHNLVIHTIITGGQALIDTLNGFAQLVRQYPAETKFVVWLNPYWGNIEDDGKKFSDMKVYLDYKDKISAIIDMPEFKDETFGKDISDMLQEKLTFDEAIASGNKTLMTRQRLKIVRDKLFSQISESGMI